MNTVFSSVIRDSLDLLLADKILHDRTSFIGLIGSLNSNEDILSWSDVDILMIIDSDKDGNLSPDVISKLKEAHEKIQQKYPRMKISFLPHTIYDLNKYVCFEYLINYSYASCLFTRTSEEYLKQQIQNILKGRKLSAEIMKRYSLYHLRHLRFNLIRKYICWNDDIKGLGRLFIDNLIEATIFINAFNGNIEKSKIKSIETASKVIRDKKITRILNESYELRSKWDNIDDETILKYIPLALESLELLLIKMNSLYPHQTAEELMNIN